MKQALKEDASLEFYIVVWQVFDCQEGVYLGVRSIDGLRAGRHAETIELRELYRQPITARMDVQDKRCRGVVQARHVRLESARK